MGVEKLHFQSCWLKASLVSLFCFWAFCYNYQTMVNPQYFWSSVVRQLWYECVCVCVLVSMCVPLVCAFYPFFWKQSGVVYYVMSFRVCSVGVMSLVLPEEAWGQPLVAVPLREEVWSLVFFLRQGTGRKPLSQRKLFPLLLALCVVLRRHSPDCYAHHEWPQISVYLQLGASEENQKGQTVVNCTGVLSWAWGRLTPNFGKAI